MPQCTFGILGEIHTLKHEVNIINSYLQKDHFLEALSNIQDCQQFVCTRAIKINFCLQEHLFCIDDCFLNLLLVHSHLILKHGTTEVSTLGHDDDNSLLVTILPLGSLLLMKVIALTFKKYESVPYIL